MVNLQSIDRKTLLYKSGVEYTDYGLNHAEGCSHGCTYPYYAMMLKEKYVNEKDLINKHIKKNSSEIEVTSELERQANRHGEIVKHSLSNRGLELEEIDPIVEYSEFILKEGTYKEQGHLIEGINTTFAIRDKKIIPLSKQ